MTLGAGASPSRNPLSPPSQICGMGARAISRFRSRTKSEMVLHLVSLANRVAIHGRYCGICGAYSESLSRMNVLTNRCVRPPAAMLLRRSNPQHPRTRFPRLNRVCNAVFHNVNVVGIRKFNVHKALQMFASVQMRNPGPMQNPEVLDCQPFGVPRLTPRRSGLVSQ